MISESRGWEIDPACHVLQLDIAVKNDNPVAVYYHGFGDLFERAGAGVPRTEISSFARRANEPSRQAHYCGPQGIYLPQFGIRVGVLWWERSGFGVTGSGEIN